MERRTDKHTGRHVRTWRGARAALGVLLAGGVLLTGCSGTPSGTKAASDSRGGSRPGPGPAASAGAAESDGAKKRDGLRESAPPDYLSTFALDVDTASYGYARRTLADGALPEPSTVRPEEFVNSFRQGYKRPDGNGFTVNVDGARAGDKGEDWSLVRVGLATRAAPARDERPPAALTFVVDISGSMAEAGRLDLVKKSLDILTDELRDDDSVSLITFSDEAETLLPMTRLRDHRGRIRDRVDSMEPTDSTNVEAGIRRGYDEAVDGHVEGANNRVVLLSDALANTGETDAAAILERIGSARRDHGITLFGVGVGSDYGDAFMEQLTDKGDGHTTYIADEEQARKVFVDQLPAHLELTARDAKAQVAFDPKTVEQFELIGYEDRKVADEDFRDDRVDGGEVGPGHTVTALYAVRLRAGASGHVATATVRWLDPRTRAPHEERGTVATGAIDGPLWGGDSKRLQVTAVAAWFAGTLRGEQLPGTPALGELASRAGKLASATEDESVRKLATAIGQADRLRGGSGDGGSGGAPEGELG
ncbi:MULTISPECIES: von Willebrand factor type A domain-containing protein [unclassified Streptomyces]|uniref:vWA domain-containing protein n=1 Tax=unclassified Streptomyces TaxID=2593676 RepID=UPI00224F90F9|nr:von Willebrand factor type A domain-containing protein [Streptomyces sp. NBC_00439]MCX5100775.1 von Willebrand factor type A domain-containing protein [Streptomyces sp. NBC_00439]